MSLHVGDQAPDFTLQYFDGNDLRPLNLGEVRALDSESEELSAKAKARTGIGP